MNIFRRRREMPPYVKHVFDTIAAHDDWTTDGYVVERNETPWFVWIGNGAWGCAPAYLLGMYMPWPRCYRQKLLDAAIDAVARSEIKRAAKAKETP